LEQPALCALLLNLEAHQTNIGPLVTELLSWTMLTFVLLETGVTLILPL
jgi:hypothetical protein